MAERDPPMRPDQLRSRSGSPLVAPPDPTPAPLLSPSPSNITWNHSYIFVKPLHCYDCCNTLQYLQWLLILGFAKNQL